MTSVADHAATAKALGDLLAAFDSEVRRAAITAHADAVKQAVATPGVTLGEMKIPGQSLMPRELLEARRCSIEFDVTLRDNGVSLSKRHRLGCGGSRARVRMEWEASGAPEATALVRTRAEAKVDKQPWTSLDPAAPIGTKADGPTNDKGDGE